MTSMCLSIRIKTSTCVDYKNFHAICIYIKTSVCIDYKDFHARMHVYMGMEYKHFHVSMYYHKDFHVYENKDILIYVSPYRFPCVWITKASMCPYAYKKTFKCMKCNDLHVHNYASIKRLDVFGMQRLSCVWDINTFHVIRIEHFSMCRDIKTLGHGVWGIFA